MHSDVSDLKIDLDALSKIKKEACQDERTNCFTETTKGFLHPSKFKSLSDKNDDNDHDFVKDLKNLTKWIKWSYMILYKLHMFMIIFISILLYLIKFRQSLPKNNWDVVNRYQIIDNRTIKMNEKE